VLLQERIDATVEVLGALVGRLHGDGDHVLVVCCASLGRPDNVALCEGGRGIEEG
jgi:hypothetical protein